MALIGKIRKNFWFVLILLGLALAAFIMMDMTGSGPAGTVTSLTIGNIDGEKINYQDFQQTEQAYFRNAQLDPFQKRKNIWDFYVENALIKNEASALGLNVSKDELMDLQFGVNQSPVIRSNWTNPQTGQIDQASLQQFRTAIENNEPLNPEFTAYWAEQEKQIIKEALEAKVYSLINKSVYTPSWMAEESFKLENSKADFNYVKIPFNEIDGEGVEVSDADIKAYMKENPAQYMNDEETRTAKIAVFNVEATQEDIDTILSRMNTLKREFKISENDSLFAISNRGSYAPIYGTKDQLPETAREEIAALEPGEIYGPFVDEDLMFVVKMIDKRPVADSVSARHILRSADRVNNPQSVETASAYIDSLQSLLKRGRVDFETLARENSQDPSVATNGGDLGTFTQSTMVREFADACFLYGKEGGIYKVTTDFGVHLIKIEDQIFNDNENKYRVSTIVQPVIPSQQTQDSVYDRVSEIVAQSRTAADLEEAVAELEGVDVQTSAAVNKNDFNLADLGPGQTSRDIVMWMFDSTTGLGDVSPEVYRYTDPVNYYDNKYVIAVLDRIIPQGLKSIEDVRDQVEPIVLNRKKGEKLASEMNVTSLEDVASQYGTEVQTASDVAVTNDFVAGVGNEPKVISSAYSLQPQSVSKPIVGNSGVFVISPLSVNDAGAPNNIPFLKRNISTTTKSQVSFRVLQGLKDKASIKDNRATFF